MKKFLVILMVVVMASFLLVGCLPTTNTGPVFTSTPGSTATVGTVYSYTPTATDADADTVTFTVAGPTGMAISTAGVITWTPTTAQIGAHTVVVTASDGTDATAQTFTLTASAAVVPVVVKTDTPYITDAGAVSILATTTQYVTAIGDLKVDGVGVAGAMIKLYIGGVYAGIGSTGTGGAFTDVIVSAITVTEGVKTFYVTATLPGLAESDASTAYTFTYDKTAPTIASVVGDSSSSYITVTFSEAVTATTVVGATWKYGTSATIYPSPLGNTVIGVSTPSATTARLTEVGTTLLTGYLLSVECSTTAITDLAGNAMVIPVIVHGTVVE